jgi:hypothetical protein
VIKSVRLEMLRCIALRHRWIPYEGEAGVAGGARVIRWVLKCQGGCGSEANEWRDLQGFRLPGTQRQYELSEEYKSALAAFTQAEAWVEIQRIGRASRQNRAG